MLVQSPEDAPFPNMPSATISRDHPDRVLPLADLAQNRPDSAEPDGAILLVLAEPSPPR